MINLASLLAATCVAFPASPLVANDEVRPEKEPYAAAHYKALKDILGADVQLQASAEERAEAREDDEVAEGPTASLKDLILRTRDGHFEVAVVEFGGFIGIGDKTVALPASRLRWDAKEEVFFVNATEAELEKLPAFDLDAAREDGLDSQHAIICESWAAAGFPKESSPLAPANHAKDAKMPRRDAGDAVSFHADHVNILRDTGYSALPTQFLCASEFSDLDVATRNEDQSGEIACGIVNCNSRALEFAVVEGLNDEEYVLPLASFVLCESDDEPCLFLAHPLSSLSTAVRYEAPEEGVLNAADAKAAKSWCEIQTNNRRVNVGS